MKVWSVFSFSFVFIVLTIGLSAIAATPDPLQESKIEFSRVSYGQYLVNVKINDQGPFKFMLDTAASRSSLFTKTLNQLQIEVPAADTRLVNGIIASKNRPVITIDRMDFAHITKIGHDIIILDDWELDADRIDGILGMDVLGEHALKFEHKTNTLTIRSQQGFKRQDFQGWYRIRLEKNPNNTTDYGLKFIRAKIGSRPVPALLDIGAGFTAINWRAVRKTILDKEKKRLQEQWKINGAIGTFTPRTKVKFAALKLDQIVLRNKVAIVMGFENLPLNQYGKYPLLILGVDLFSNHDFALDFINDQVFMHPSLKAQRSAIIEGSDLRRILEGRHRP